MDIAYLSEVDPLWNDSTLSMLINPEAALFGNLMAQAPVRPTRWQCGRYVARAAVLVCR
jgi:hypothetical protein